jgi:hypothetical protein
VPDALLGRSLDGEHQVGGVHAADTIRPMVFRCLNLRALPTSRRSPFMAREDFRRLQVTSGGLFSP